MCTTQHAVWRHQSSDANLRRGVKRYDQKLWPKFTAAFYTWVPRGHSQPCSGPGPGWQAGLRQLLMPQATGLEAEGGTFPLSFCTSVSLNRTIWGWGTSVTSQIPEKNILALRAWGTETVVPKPQHPSCHAAQTNLWGSFPTTFPTRHASLHPIHWSHHSVICDVLKLSLHCKKL